MPKGRGPIKKLLAQGMTVAPGMIVVRGMVLNYLSGLRRLVS